MKYKRKSGHITGINVAPLIDVIFILVIFFMVSSTLIIHKGMLVKLPKAKNVKSVTQAKLVVYITKEGNIFVNEDEISLVDLKSKIAEFIKLTNKRDVTIKADKEIIYGEVIKVIDICKEAGILNISFTTKKIDKIEL